MNSQVWWFVARSSGIVAWALLSASVLWGLLLSSKVSTTRIAARRLRPAWLLDLHRHLGGLAVIFTAIHLVGIVADSYVTFGWIDVLVPMASEWKPGAVAFGVVAMYLLVAIEATSLAIRRLSRSVWRWIHRSSFVLYATATWHGVSAGTDAENQWFRLAAWVSLVLVLALTLRLVLILRRTAARGTVPAPLAVPARALPAPVSARAVPAAAAVPVVAARAAPAVSLSAPPAPALSRIARPYPTAIAPLPATLSEMMMPPNSVAPMPEPARPAPRPRPVGLAPFAPPQWEAPVVAAPTVVVQESALVGVSSGGSDGGDLAPPTVDS